MGGLNARQFIGDHAPLIQEAGVLRGRDCPPDREDVLPRHGEQCLERELAARRGVLLHRFFRQSFGHHAQAGRVKLRERQRESVLARQDGAGRLPPL